VTVDFHLDLTRELAEFPLRIDPCLSFLPRLAAAGGYGVIDMALLSVIRRWALRGGLSIWEISRRTGLSRNAIRKYLRSGAVEPRFNVSGALRAPSLSDAAG